MSVNDNLFISTSFCPFHLTSRAQPPHRMHIHAPILLFIRYQLAANTDCHYAVLLIDMIWLWMQRRDWSCFFFLFSSFALRSSIATRFHLWHFIRSHSCALALPATALAAVFLRIYFSRIFISLMPLHSAHTLALALRHYYCLLNWLYIFFFFFKNSIATWESTKSNTLAN